MKLQTVCDVLDTLESSVDYQEKPDFKSMIDEFKKIFSWRYRPALVEMQETGKYGFPEYMLKTDISRRLRKEFNPLYEIYQARIRDKKD